MQKNLVTLLELVALGGALALGVPGCGAEDKTSDSAMAGCPTTACPTTACPTTSCPTMACPTTSCPTAACPTSGHTGAT